MAWNQKVLIGLFLFSALALSALAQVNDVGLIEPTAVTEPAPAADLVTEPLAEPAAVPAADPVVTGTPQEHPNLPEVEAAAANPQNNGIENRGHLGGPPGLARLGKDLPTVAQRYGKSAAELTKLFQTDSDLLVDPGLNLVYRCSILDAPDAPIGNHHHHHHHHHHHRKLSEANVEVADPTLASLTFSATGVPLLHSRTGSRFKIYLDFDGHTAAGVMWNQYNTSAWACSKTSCASIVSPAFNYDNVAGFSAVEKTMMVDIWRAVAEDYSVFEVDVTTEDPGVEALRKVGTSDTQWGIRVVIGGN